ncbi:trypsin [Lentzea atacamensis]|uniref:Trypsin n=1 Tax=Lentzea atacamensis TaxID=531938 RepID=A0ABX9DW64_9PSEU|nr:trypsin-like serine protease [Lentzea atacamensis]RAS59536.1 trypsin [Lentzea atacamensis]
MRSNIQRATVALLATVTLVTAGATATVAQPDTPPSGDISTQVVGGRQATQLPPGLAALEYDSESGFRDDHQTCTTVLLEKPGRPGWVQSGLTAAHCVSERPAGPSAASTRLAGEFGSPIWVPVKDRKFQLRAGSLDRTLVAPLPITQVVIAPWWKWIPGGPDPVDPTPAADLAMFFLAEPIQVRGATVDSAEPRPGTPVRAVGWGRTSNLSAATPTIANELRTRIIRPQECAAGDISLHDLCTANPGGDGACNADSGAGVYVPVNGRLLVTGLVSRGATALCGGSPDVHQGLGNFKPWIDKVQNGTIRIDLPLTPEQGGPIAHPTIKFTTTEAIELPKWVPVR